MITQQVCLFSSLKWECFRLEFLTVTDDTAEQFSADIPELMWSTGPVSYEYHLGTRALLDAVALFPRRVPV